MDKPRDMRLQKYLAAHGIASRRGAEELLKTGRVCVNGTPATEPGLRVSPHKDVITLDGKKLDKPAAFRTIMLYKPRGYICSAADDAGHIVYELLRDIPERLMPAGRLDKNSEGLLLLSNDGNLILKLTHPRFLHPKTYHVTVSGDTGRERIKMLNSRLIIDGYQIQPAQVRVLRTSTTPGRMILEFILHEGRNRQIRAMCELAGLEVHRLVRTKICSLPLKGLKPGEWRDLTADEVRQLNRIPNAPPPQE
jgi:23S rRNA pseudouridine2605 synthase